jgi:hypothetical protein
LPNPESRIEFLRDPKQANAPQPKNDDFNTDFMTMLGQGHPIQKDKTTERKEMQP